MRLRRFVSVVVAVALLASLLGPGAAAALDRATTQQVMRGVVQFIAVDEGRGGTLTPKWTGSGTIISPDGLILTNCHVAYPVAMYNDPEFEYDLLIVAITVRSDEAPLPSYIAEVVQYDASLDLAVVRITQTIDGTPVDPSALNLPSVPLGDSNQLEIGDPVSIFGYPGIGGETITFTSGNVSGFSSAQGVKGRAWIKTDATVAGGNSGGTAVDEQGFLVGVPTKFGAGDDQDPVDCRQYADTNNDGRIDRNDACIPMGGFINALRPVNLALPLIEAAMMGLQTEPASRDFPTRPTVTGRPQVGRQVFAPMVDEFDQPFTVAHYFPSGTEDIYLVFDYDGFTDGVQWQPVLVYEGQAYNDIWAPEAWNAGASGTTWVSIHAEPLADGLYEFLIFYDGEQISSAAVEVGGPVGPSPMFSEIIFFSTAGVGYLQPAGIDEVRADFNYWDLPAGQDWSYVWYYEREPIAEGAGEALRGSSGVATVMLTSSVGLQAGTYRLELYLDDTLAATADFVAGGQAQSLEVFGPITFAEGVDRNGNPINPGTTFRAGISELYAFFDYQGMQDGWEWSREWTIDGQVVTGTSDVWEAGESGELFWVSIISQDTLPTGEYGLTLSVLGEVVQEGTCTIAGTARRPITPRPRAGDLEVFGYIVDSVTGQGIPGAYLLVLQPGVTTDTFSWTEEEVYAWGETDREGYFELSQPLVRGETYTLVAGADGYYGVGEDGIYIDEEMESPFGISISLQPLR